jgi:hypothetical protein
MVFLQYKIKITELYMKVRAVRSVNRLWTIIFLKLQLSSKLPGNQVLWENLQESVKCVM